MEIVWTGAGSLVRGNWQLSAFTYLWMFPIYGLGVYLEKTHDRIRSWSWFARGIIWMTLIFCFEYLSGWLLKELLGSCPWDYGNTPLTVNGLIRLDYAPVWFVLGLLFERLHDALEKMRIS